MMPPPEEVAGLVDRADEIAMRSMDRLWHKTPEDRRRLLAEAVFEILRHQRQDRPAAVPIGV